MQWPVDVSVIIAVHNGMPYVERTLQSLLSQTIGLSRMQVVIVDDGSTDGTAEVVDALAAAHGLQVIHQVNSGGPAGPRNTALEQALGRYVFFLDADDHLSDDALEAMVSAADANGTDVVVARMRGVGGRPTPRLAFTRSWPRTDVFHSRIYGSLNPMKLFRTSTIRRLGLRFPVDVPWGEDQPFVAAVYLEGDGITVLADKDYIFWGYREDRSNITTRAVSLADRMPVADRMFDLVASKVAPGADRDRLMTRHFRSELVSSAFEGYRTERDRAVRSAAFARFGAIADAHYNGSIEAALSPAARVLMRLVNERRDEDFAGYLDLLAAAGPPQSLSEDGRLFLGLPWFRAPGRNLPDELFDIERQLRAWCRTEPVLVDGAGIHVTASCGLGAVSHLITGVSLVLRDAAGDEMAEVPLAYSMVAEEGRHLAEVRDVVDPDRLLRALPAGLFGVFLRVSAGEVKRECRMAECAPPAMRPRIAHSSGSARPRRSAILITTKKGNLSVSVVEGRLTPRGYLLRERRDRIVRSVKQRVKRLIGR